MDALLPCGRMLPLIVFLMYLPKFHSSDDGIVLYKISDVLKDFSH